MPEREPQNEIIGKGELFFLGHPGTDIFSGYGLTMQPDSTEFLVGLLMVDRPQPADPEWLNEIETTFGEYQLVAMTEKGERGIVCQMQILPESQEYLRQYPTEKAAAIQTALTPLLDELPNPVFSLSWSEEKQAWQSQLPPLSELPDELREVFEKQGYGCAATETNIGIVHVCHAADEDIAGFAGKLTWYQWQLIQMPTAPLIRLEMVIVDDPVQPYKFESFLNAADASQARTLDQLANQEQLHMAFYGEDLTHRFTKTLTHSALQRWQLEQLVLLANRYWESLPETGRDFDQAKAEFMSQFI